jgi:hypothetical protein
MISDARLFRNKYVIVAIAVMALPPFFYYYGK